MIGRRQRLKRYKQALRAWLRKLLLCRSSASAAM